MKNIFKTLGISLMLILSISSCDEQFLEQKNLNNLTVEQFWQDEDDFQKGLVTVYGSLQYTAVTGQEMASAESVRSDVGRSFDFYNAYLWDLFEWNQSTPYVSNRWDGLYIGVNRANQVLTNLRDVEASDSFTLESIQLIEGQAKFLRALFYFWIANSYNGAVLVPEDASEINNPFVSRELVIEQVKRDLRDAIELLPTTWSTGNVGRATWGAAMSLLGKVYLYEVRPSAPDNNDQLSYDSAAYCFNEVIESGLYSLTTNIEDNFTDLNEFNSESIFEVSYNRAVNPGVSADSKEDVFTTAGGEANAKARLLAPQNRGGFRVMVPAHWLNELYEDDQVDGTNPINSFGNAFSVRAYWSIAFLRQDDGPLDGAYYNRVRDIRAHADWFNGGAESCYWKKGTNWYQDDSENPLGRSGINERIIRLADVYLLYAEALLQGGTNLVGVGDAQARAIELIDLVRSRAGVITLDRYINENANQIPQLHKRGVLLGTNPFVNVSAENLLTHIQFVERPLELSMEGVAIRWNDLVRWGLVREAFENQREHNYVRDDGSVTKTLDFCGSVCPEIELLSDAIVRYTTNTAQVVLDVYNEDTRDRFDYFPIPISETNANPGL